MLPQAHQVRVNSNLLSRFTRQFRLVMEVLCAGVILLSLACKSSSEPQPPALQPPTALTYTVNPAVYTKGTAITANAPHSTGGAVSSYGVVPALPAGLNLSATTGVVTGTPTALAAAANYVVTATNAGGSTTVPLNITIIPGAATHFSVSGFTNPTIAGTAHNITVTALDANNDTAVGYSGTVHFTSTDPAAMLPTDATLTTGVGTFAVTLKTAGSQTISVTDTVVSALTGSQAAINVNPGAATHFSVSGFMNPTVAGDSHSFTVTALDSANNIATGYAGTVHIASTDSNAALPSDATLTSGTLSFTATLNTVGTQSITATDSITASITGTQTGITVNSGAATHFGVIGYANPTSAGVSHTFTVTALDAANNTAAGYRGTVHFTSSDSAANLPADYSFTAGDNGVRSFNLAFATVGTRAITVTDTVNASVTGSQAGILVNPGTATHFAVTGYPNPTVSGVAHGLTVTALDANNNTATGYLGTVHFSSSDPSAVLPGDFTFTILNSGAEGFTITLNTAGTHTITVTDTVTASLAGSQGSIAVNPGSATHFSVSGFANPTLAGASHTFLVSARDAANNTATGYSGTVHFTSTDGSATLPVDGTLIAGTGTFNAALKTAGTQALTAIDTVTASITGTQAGILVNPGTAASFTVSGFANPTISGATHSFTVTAKDADGNVVPSYPGTVHFTSTDGTATLPVDGILTSGTGTFSATLKTAGIQSLVATDTVSSSITGSQTGIVVNPGTATHFGVSGFSNPTVAGAPHILTVTALDANENTAVAYTGTVHITSSDASATLPANYAYTAGDSGTHAFALTLNTEGTQSITATDTITATLTGSQAGIVVTAAPAITNFIAYFDGVVDPGSSTAGLTLTSGMGIEFSTSLVDPIGTGCGGSSYEYNVTITNTSGATLNNVYAEIQNLSLAGRESCSSNASPLPGSTTITSANGLWAFGNIPAGGSATVRWYFNNPTATPYTFKGRVFTVGELQSNGAGNGLLASIKDVLVDSDGANLYVTVKMDTPPNGSDLFLLVDDTNRASGMTGPGALTYDPTGTIGALSVPGTYTIGNSAGGDFDFFQVGSFAADGTLTQTHHKTITGATSSADAAGVAMNQDVAAGRYHFRIPYSAIGSGAVGGDPIKVYVLYGKNNTYGVGIHSAAPTQPQAQIDLMNNAAGLGLSDLASAPSSHTLAVTCAPAVVISAVYGGGGGTSATATYNRDYIELHNRSSASFTIPAGWSLQYGSAAGNYGSVATNIHVLPTITIPAGGYALFVEGTAGTGGAAIPVTADATGTLALSGTSGKVALATISTPLGACGSIVPGTVIDEVGYGTAVLCAGSPTSALSVTTAAVRNNNGCDRTGNCSADFTVGATPVPRNSASLPVTCPQVCR
ncbi:MAG: hypothetical protein IPN59_17300 [Holophaga sp.]|nr:hypothetical protein [Holophaga sp.]